MYLKQAKINSKTVKFPVYLPDATRAVIRSIGVEDLRAAKIEGIVVNPYHLLSQPGLPVIEKAGGVGRFMSWDGLAVSDSGGWQLLSMVHKDKNLGRINDNGVVFNLNSLGEKKKQIFTPEKSISVQFALKADLIVCLDDCPGISANVNDFKISVERTVYWAKRGKEEFLRQKEKNKDKNYRPSLMAVVQGGPDRKLRKRCANELIKIGFDAYGFGGWTLNEKGAVDFKLLKIVSQLLPNNKPKFALGVGDPWAIVNGFNLGYQIFDCVLPTRDARHQRLYVFKTDPAKTDILKNKNIHQYLYVNKEKQADNLKPVSDFCDCLLCRNYSRAYLRHLFKIKDSLAWRLSTIHNLRTYSRLIELLRKSKN